MKHLAARLLFLALFALFATTLFAQDFSADFVSTRTSGGTENSGKLFISGDKVRFESTRPSPRGDRPVMIMDMAQHTTTMLMPDRHMYISLPQGKGITVPIWHMVNVNNACPEWQVYSAQLKTNSKMKSCEKTGSDTIDGRSAVKYTITSDDGKVGTVWLDPKLRTMLKHQDADGTAEFKNIKEGTQPASLFEVPAGYQKMNVPGMAMPGGSPN